MFLSVQRKSISELDINVEQIRKYDTRKLKHTDLNVDTWCKIFSYLDLKSIYSLELTAIYFKQVLERIRFWERKIRKEFPNFEYDQLEEDINKKYYITRKSYWNLYYQNHLCNVCKLCFIESICSNIPNCEKCDWLQLLE